MMVTDLELEVRNVNSKRESSLEMGFYSCGILEGVDVSGSVSMRSSEDVLVMSSVISVAGRLIPLAPTCVCCLHNIEYSCFRIVIGYQFQPY